MMRIASVVLIARRELASYFSTPIAYVFLMIFLALNGVFGFYLGSFVARDQADLDAFFQFHPWLYLVLIPALSMRLWAEERRSGSLELLLTLPVSTVECVLGKFLAAWLFTLLALLGTLPMWLTVNYLGQPDNGAIAAAYAGSFLLAGGILAVGCCLSAVTKNQVVAFIATTVTCLAMMLLGFHVVIDTIEGFLPGAVVDALTMQSFFVHFNNIRRGVLSGSDLLYFLTAMMFWLYANVVVIEYKKAD
jgi:ABC-2 type transport system permease protein